MACFLSSFISLSAERSLLSFASFPIHQSIHPCVHTAMDQYIYLVVHLCTNLTIYPPIHSLIHAWITHLSASLCIYPFNYPLIHYSPNSNITTHLSDSWPTYLSSCPSNHPFISVLLICPRNDWIMSSFWIFTSTMEAWLQSVWDFFSWI